MTTTCASCGTPTSAEDRFCGRCGTRLGGSTGPAGRFCTRCGSSLVEGARFCPSCGAEQRPAGEAASAPRDPSASGNGMAGEDEDLLAEWEDALRFARPLRADDASITETIVRTPPAPATEALPLPAPMAEPAVFSQPEPSPRRAPPPTPAPAPRREPGAPFRFPLGATLALLGAVAVIVSAVLPWDGAFGASLPRDIAAPRLLDPGAAADGVSLGMLLLVIGTIGALVALTTMAVPVLKPLRRLVGLVSLSLPVLFALRTAAPLVAEGAPAELWTALGVGAYVAAGGGFVQLVAGRWFRR